MSYFPPELIKFAAWFADNFQTLNTITPDSQASQGTYHSDEKNYLISYFQNWDNPPGDTPDVSGCPIRVLIGAPVLFIRFSKANLMAIPEFSNANFVFSLVIWAEALRDVSVATETLNDIEADKITFQAYREEGRPLDDFKAGWLKMLSMTGTADDIHRSGALQYRINNLQTTAN